MSSYSFCQWCRPTGDFRVPEIVLFLHVMKETFQCSDIYDARNKPVDLTQEVLRRILEKNVHKIFPDLGASVEFFTIPPRERNDDTVRIEIHTGTHPDKPFIDSYDLSMDGTLVPDFQHLRDSIEIFEPFEACLEDAENEYRLDAFDRQQAIPKFDKPAIIRGFHYLDEFMTRSIGGIDYCLNAPAWKVEKFCEGILIQLVKGVFNWKNPKHRKIQREAMDYFDLL
jgi:hypothetical protein